MVREPDPPAAATFLESPQPELTSNGLQILLVEDHVDTASSTAYLLGLYGHKVRVALDGKSALQAAKETFPDVMLIDIGLPDMDGYEVARKIAEHPHDRKPLFIAVTGFGSEGYHRHSTDSIIDLHLLKPLDPERLEKLLRRFQAIIT